MKLMWFHGSGRKPRNSAGLGDSAMGTYRYITPRKCLVLRRGAFSPGHHLGTTPGAKAPYRRWRI